MDSNNASYNAGQAKGQTQVSLLFSDIFSLFQI